MSKYDGLPCNARSHVSNNDCRIAHKRLAVEAKIVRALLRGLKREGFLPISVDDGGDEWVTVKGETQTMDALFAVDMATVLFRKGGRGYGVAIVLGNGEDCISDWSAPLKDTEGWCAAMDAVTSKIDKLIQARA